MDGAHPAQNVDPVTLLDVRDRATLAGTQQLLLPTWVPDWLPRADGTAIANPATGLAGMQWTLHWPTHPLAESLDSDVEIGVFREPRSDRYPALSGPPLETTVRSYTLGAAVAACADSSDGGPLDTILLWEDADFRYGVSMTPTPGCWPQLPLSDVRRLADSLVECSVAADGLDISCA
jgi:hypothetical protein